MNSSLKKIFAIIPVITAMLMTTVFSASANLIGEDGFYYSLTDSDHASLESYHGSGSVIQIPSVIYSHEVNSISDYAFLRNQTITEVTLPSTIKTIGNSSFNYCSNLQKIVIPDSVSKIGRNAFSNCGSLTIYCNTGSFAETYAIKNNLPVSTNNSANNSAVIGDVDGDNEISSYDSLLVLRYSVGLENFTENQKYVSDVNEDNSIDSFDSLVILRCSVGIDVSQYKIGSQTK